VSGDSRRPRTGWRADPAGAVFSFAIEVLIVVLLAIVAILIAAVALWLV